MAPKPPPDPLVFETPAELRDWFDANHETASELWLGSYKKATGKPSVQWSEAVDEALCVGWIDSVRYSLDAERSAQRFTPRRKGSNWSAVNIAKVAELTAQGRMRPAGLAAFEARSDDRTAVYSYEQRHEAAFAPEDEARFRANAGCLGVVGEAAGLLSDRSDLLGRERQEAGDAGPPARHVDRGFGRRPDGQTADAAQGSSSVAGRGSAPRRRRAHGPASLKGRRGP